MNIIVAILIFGFIIFIHELGHFYFAKKAGVTIYEFSIGMGPKIFSKEKNNTLYSLRALPIGGYVAMAGEDEESDDENSFDKKPIKDRLASIFAGPVANIVLCFVLLSGFFMIVGTPTTNILEQVAESSPAYEAGLKKGDKIISVDNKSISNFEELSSAISSSNGKELKVKYNRNSSVETTSIKPVKNNEKYIIGITPKNEKNPIKAIPYAFSTTYNTSKSMLQFIWKLVTGQLSGNIVNSLAGPVGVVQIVSNAATSGILNLVYLTAIISLNIGLMNLLPIPALDGWRILILMIEALRRGKKLPAKVEGYINGIGLIALLSFMIFITYKDILRIIG
ncbi:RIP metalloprotease RseP [Peptostreptococcus faecalis]|uniref:RIP metalloprotease RseP n=1 Tax=Peptostreptococcus faecalis TaxID=2045015 RepID=UPI000C7A77F4|nr:RIP metalloprotease RseP [Peptostreptococcus faecalis]